MRTHQWTTGPDSRPEAPAPAVCPACRSAAITNGNKAATTRDYWRCVDCGEVWNQARRISPPRRSW